MGECETMNAIEKAVNAKLKTVHPDVDKTPGAARLTRFLLYIKKIAPEIHRRGGMTRAQCRQAAEELKP